MVTHSIDELLKDKTEPPKALIGGGILLQNDMLLIAGAKKSRKTFLVYNLGLALTLGKSFAGFNIDEKHKVLMFSAEGGYYPNRDRFQKMCSGLESPEFGDFHICFDSRLKIENDKDYENIKERIVEFDSDVVIIDPFIKFHSKDENSAQEMGFILERLRYLIEDHSISIILVHHQGKEPKAGARGSSAITGEYGSCITTKKEGGEESLVHKITFDLRHSITPDPRELIFNSETFWFELDLTPSVAIISKYGPLSKQNLVEKIISNGYYKQSGAYASIDRDVNNKLIFLHSDDKYYLNITN
jgi:hypothetical protein